MERVYNPLISCLCVTRNKPRQLYRVVECFLGQTYQNKELVIVYEDDNQDMKQIMKTLVNKHIKFYEVPTDPKLSLGTLRNFSVSMASGEYFCQWDDDDWYHSSRLEVQIDAVLTSHKPASLLPYWLMYDMVNHRSFMSTLGPWPGSILCKKSIINEKIRYPDLGTHEDAYFLMTLIRHNCIFPIVMPHIYIYTYHGNNTFQFDHFNYIFSQSQPLPDHVTDLINGIFAGKIAHAEASRLLASPEVLGEVNYFQNFSVPGEE